MFLIFSSLAPVYAETDITITPLPEPPAIDSQAREQQIINNIPGNATLVDDAHWSDEHAENVKDMVDYIPGVIAEPRDGAESERLSVRGSDLANIFQGSGLLVMQDGIPLNMADGEFEFPVIDPWLTRFTEVFPGANALQYGASNFGGAINFITPTGATGNGYDLRTEVGSFATLHSEASVGKQWQGGDVFASAAGFAQSGYREQNEQDTTRFNGNLGLQFNDNFSNRIYITHIHSDAEIPGAITLTQVEQDPKEANPANVANNYQRDLDITRLADKSAWQQGDDRVDTAVFYTYRTLDNPVTTYEFQTTNDVGFTTKYTHKSEQDQWLIGVNDYYGSGDETRYKNDDATPGTYLIGRNLSAQTSEAYTEYDKHLMGNLFGIADLQVASDTRDIHQSYPYVAKQDETYNGFNPRIGLRYDITYDQQLFANLSRSFEPPTLSDLSGGNNPGFASLKAQKATTAELGSRLQWNDMHFQAAYYHGWLHNELVNYQFADGDTATTNAVRSKRDGIELGMDGDVRHTIFITNDAVTMRGSYTYSHYTLDHDPVFGNNVVPGVPENYIRAELLYRHPWGISLGPNVEWSPTPAPVDLANTLYTDSYAIYGFRTFWESSNHELNIYIEGSNLLNKNYAATYNVVPDAAGIDGRDFYPGEGRAIYAGLRYKL